MLVFFDDLLVYNPSLDTHLTHLKTVLNILREQQIYAKRSKCSFAEKEVTYLGHIISEK